MSFDRNPVAIASRSDLHGFADVAAELHSGPGDAACCEIGPGYRGFEVVADGRDAEHAAAGRDEG